MSLFLEIVLQLLSCLLPWQTSERNDSQMARIGNFFGGFFYVFLGILVLFALARHFLSPF
jgi:hypothetical protein